MYKHHEESINNLIKLFENNDEVIAILLGGSIAKGEEKESSDIDAMIILNDSAYESYSLKGKLSEGISEHCTYPGGYFDLKYFN